MIDKWALPTGPIASELTVDGEFITTSGKESYQIYIRSERSRNSPLVPGLVVRTPLSGYWGRSWRILICEISTSPEILTGGFSRFLVSFANLSSDMHIHHCASEESKG